MICPRCGASTIPGATFCTQCGAPLGVSGAGSAATAAAPQGAAERSLYVFALAAVGCLALFFGLFQLVVLLSIAKSFGVFLVAVILAILPVPIYAALIIALDRHVREPVWLLAGAFFWGAVVATSFAIVLNTGAESIIKLMIGANPGLAQQLTASFSAPPVEETSKGLALLLIWVFFRAQINDVVDGIVLGALVGLGFAMTENILYFARAYADGGLIGAGVNFYVRVILGGFGHSMYTAATGAGLGLAAETTNPLVRGIAPVAGWCTAMFLHFLWNTVPAFVDPLVGNVGAAVQLLLILPFQELVLSLPSIATLLIITFVAWRRENTVIAEYLRDEVGRGVVTSGEYAVLSDDRSRTRRVWQNLFAHGPAAWYVLRQFYNEAAALAFRKWHTAKGERLPSYLRGQSEEAHRAQIARLRRRLEAVGVTAG
jgi:protease PrsW